MHKYLKGGCHKDTSRLFLVVPNNRTKDNDRNWNTESTTWAWVRASLWEWLSIGTECWAQRGCGISCLWRHSKGAWRQSWVVCSKEICFNRQVGLDHLQWSFLNLSVKLHKTAWQNFIKTGCQCSHWLVNPFGNLTVSNLFSRGAGVSRVLQFGEDSHSSWKEVQESALRWP